SRGLVRITGRAPAPTGASRRGPAADTWPHLTSGTPPRQPTHRETSLSHWRLNNPRANRVKTALANRVKHRPRHAFCAERAIVALWEELVSSAVRPMYRAGTSEMAVIPVVRGSDAGCRDG